MAINNNKQKENYVHIEWGNSDHQMLLCTVKLELTYSDPNRAFKVSEILRSGFTNFTPP